MIERRRTNTIKNLIQELKLILENSNRNLSKTDKVSILHEARIYLTDLLQHYKSLERETPPMSRNNSIMSLPKPIPHTPSIDNITILSQNQFEPNQLVFPPSSPPNYVFGQSPVDPITPNGTAFSDFR